MAARTSCLRRCSTRSTTSPSQQGVEGTDSEEVWMMTEESAILVMSTSLLGKICILPSKEAHFIPACYKLYLAAQFVGDEERNLQPSQGVYLMESAFPRDIRPNAHASRRVLTLHPKTRS